MCYEFKLRKNKIEFYKDFPIEGVEYIDLNPIIKTNS